MRMALAQAVHHCRHRSVFQQAALRPADDARGAGRSWRSRSRARWRWSCGLRARSITPRAIRARRPARGLLTPAAKYWICKTAPGFIYEAMECLGGNGYVEESMLPRLYREAPVNAIWEGSGNVMCLDVLRALRRDEEAAELLR